MISGERLREYGLLVSFYFIAVGVLYLWGYWSTFEVNILEYISLTDIVKVTLIPIISSFIFFALGAVLGELMTAETFPPGGGVSTPTGRFLNQYKSLLLGSYWIFIFVVYYFGPVEKWFILAVLISIPISATLRNQSFLRDFIPNDSANAVTVFLLCALPLFAYGHGIISADKIVKGSSYKYLEIETNKVSTGVSDKTKENEYNKFKFLGFMNNYVFLMPVENRTVIIARFDRLEPIALKAYSKRD